MYGGETEFTSMTEPTKKRITFTTPIILINIKYENYGNLDGLVTIFKVAQDMVVKMCGITFT